MGRGSKGKLALALAAALGASAAGAEVVLDGTLGRAGALAGPNFSITADLGRQVGGNLFHSFSAFGLTTGESATFSGPGSVTNVISRVTGGGISNIDGRIASTIAGANFYLLNPAGIVFGPNASLDVSGSVHISTADYLRLADDALFHASDPGASTLTAAEPAAFGFLGQGAALEVNGATLSAGAGKTLALSGGDVSLTGATLSSQGGGVELRSQSDGAVTLTDSTVSAAGLGETPPGAIRIFGGRITLNRSTVRSENATAAQAGEIQVEAAGSLSLGTGTIGSTTSGEGVGGDVRVAAADAALALGSKIQSSSEAAGASGGVHVTLTGALSASGEDASGDSSAIGTEAYATGDAGAVAVEAGSIDLRDGAQIKSNSFGEMAFAGSGGAILVDVRDSVLFSGVNSGGFPSGITAISFGPGAPGHVSLSTDTLGLRNGGVISTSTYGDMSGAGGGGSITVSAASAIELSGVNANGRISGIRADSNGTGAAGYVTISSPVLELTEGAQISSTAYDTGADAGWGGYVAITAGERLLIDGVGPTGRSSGIFANTYGAGYAGNLYVTAGDITLRGGGQLGSTSYGTDPGAGSGGFISATATGTLAITGTSVGGRKSGIFANTEGPGAAGYISVDAGRVDLAEGGRIASTTSGTMDGAGNGGTVILKAGAIAVSGIGANGSRDPSGVFSESSGPGDAGYLQIEAESLELSSGGQISSTSFGTMPGAGAGGYVYLTTTGTLRVTGAGATGYSSGIFADTWGEGSAGYLQIGVGSLDLSGGGQISSTSLGTMQEAGSGGGVFIEVSGAARLTGVGANGRVSGVFATTWGPGAAGFITLNAAELALLDGAQINSTSFGTMGGAGDGGYISVSSAGETRISGVGSNGYPSALVAETYGPGDAGYISLETESLRLTDGGTISSGTFGTETGSGRSGGIDITASTDISVSGVNAGGRASQIVSDSNGPGAAGNISLSGRNIELADGGLVSSTAYGGTGDTSTWANITVSATDTLRVAGVHASGNRSGIYTNSEGTAFAGDIIIESGRLELVDGGLVSASSLGEMANARGEGIIGVTSGSILISGAGPDGFPSGIYTSTYGPGSAGSITIDAGSIELRGGGRISSASHGEMAGAGNSGWVSVTVSDALSITGMTPEGEASGIFAQTHGPGQAGYVSVEAGRLTMGSGAEISSATLGTGPGAGNGGNVEIMAGRVELAGLGGDGTPTRIGAESRGPGNAGGIYIGTDDALVLSAGAQIATRADHADGGNITLEAGEQLKLSGSRIITSVGSGIGNGGNIDIDPRFVVLNNGLIQANAYGGNGGNIRIVTDHLVSSVDSRIEASSELGIAGSIEVSSPNVDVGSGLTVLPSQFLDASLLLRDSCAGRAGRSASSSFVGVGNGGLPQGPDELFASRYDDPLIPAAAGQLQAQGKRREALRELEQALAAARATAGPAPSAGALGALGQAYLLAGLPGPARQNLEAALAQVRTKGAPNLESALLNDLAQLELIEERPQQASMAFDAALRAAARAGDPGHFARAALNGARQSLRDGNADTADTLLDEARRQLAAAADSADKAYQLIAIGRLQGQRAARPGSLQSAHQSLAEAGRIAARLGDARAASFALGHLGELYAANGRGAQALLLARRALFLAQLAQAPDALYRWHWQVARTQAAAGQADAAMAAYQRALASLQAIRQDLIADLRVSRGSYRDTVGPLFQEYADLLLRRASATEGMQRTSWLRRARETVEQLKTVELEDYFQDECVASQQAKKRSLDEVPEGTVVLYPILLPDRVEMLLSLPGRLEQVRLEVDGKSLAAEAQAFRRRLEKRTTHEYLPHARRLYAWLIRPIEAQLKANGIDTLVFVPDGPLRGIPLAALHDGRRFLVDTYAVAVAPGLSLVDDLPASRRKGNSLLGGLTESVQNFPALPYVDPEVRSIQSVFGGKALKDAQFVIPDFERELQSAAYTVVHIASHGQIESDPRKSFLLAYDGKITMDDLEGYMKFGRLREDPVELLTLSACRTAAGDERAALGLAGVAVKAGARSALATLWYVSDQASSMLMTGFYRELASGQVSKARALQSAQRKVLADPRYRHPGYWAPFLLIGNWR